MYIRTTEFEKQAHFVNESNIIREAVRYLGYKRSLLSKGYAIDERTLELVQSSLEELKQAANVRFIYRIFEISFGDEDELILGQLRINSKSLHKNLHDCRNAVVLGITLGTGVDRLIKKYSITEMSRAVVLQACAAALLEEYCDYVEFDIKANIKKELAKNLYFRPRFSPGYGDFSILHQKELLQMIEAPKKIGLTMTEGYMLTPTKSVTAVIGISKSDRHCNTKGCEECNKSDCIYRRN